MQKGVAKAKTTPHGVSVWRIQAEDSPSIRLARNCRPSTSALRLGEERRGAMEVVGSVSALLLAPRAGHDVHPRQHRYLPRKATASKHTCIYIYIHTYGTPPPQGPTFLKSSLVFAVCSTFVGLWGEQ